MSRVGHSSCIASHPRDPPPQVALAAPRPRPPGWWRPAAQQPAQGEALPSTVNNENSRLVIMSRLAPRGHYLIPGGSCFEGGCFGGDGGGGRLAPPIPAPPPPPPPPPASPPAPGAPLRTMITGGGASAGSDLKLVHQREMPEPADLIALATSSLRFPRNREQQVPCVRSFDSSWLDVSRPTPTVGKSPPPADDHSDQSGTKSAEAGPFCRPPPSRACSLQRRDPPRSAQRCSPSPPGAGWRARRRAPQRRPRWRGPM